MKRLFSIALITLFTIGVFAQEQKKERKRPKFTAEQIAELQTKKMTLDLELSERQQQQIFEINKQNAIERKQKIAELKTLRAEGKKPSNDQLFELKKNRLDKQIAHQAAMKKILNEKQFDAWKKTRKHRAQKGKRKMAKRKMAKRKMMKRRKHRRKVQDRK